MARIRPTAGCLLTLDHGIWNLAAFALVTERKQPYFFTLVASPVGVGPLCKEKEIKFCNVKKRRLRGAHQLNDPQKMMPNQDFVKHKQNPLDLDGGQGP